MGCAADSDVYATVLLRDRPNRRARDSRALSGSYAWLDADGWDADRHERLLGLGCPVLVVDAGSPGHRHLYLDIGSRLSAGRVTDCSRRLQVMFRTDTHGGDNKLLRVPGTVNHRARLTGHGDGALTWMR